MAICWDKKQSMASHFITLIWICAFSVLACFVVSVYRSSGSSVPAYKHGLRLRTRLGRLSGAGSPNDATDALPASSSHPQLAGKDNLTAVKGNPNVLLFNRVPKCGGTTVTAVFEELTILNNFKMQKLKTIIPTSPHMTRSQLAILVQEMAKQRKPALYIGHLHFIHFGEYDQMYPSYINLIREPLERLVSDYYFRDRLCLQALARNKTCPQRHVDKTTETFDMCVELNRPFCSEPNRQGYFNLIPFFCGNAQHSACYNSSQWALNQAKQNVLKYYTTIGITQEIEKFLDILENMLPQFFTGAKKVYLKGSGEEGPLVMNQGQEKVLPSDKTAAIMKDRLRYEYDFYHFVKQRFYQQYSEVVKQS